MFIREMSDRGEPSSSSLHESKGIDFALKLHKEAIQKASSQTLHRFIETEQAKAWISVNSKLFAINHEYDLAYRLSNVLKQRE